MIFGTNSIVEASVRVAREFGIQRPPVDLDVILEAWDITLHDWGFPDSIQEVVTPYAIGLNSSISDPFRRRELIAHALGHWYLHRENGLAIASKNDQLRQLQVERQAWTFAERLLVPVGWLFGQWGRELWEIAEECRVTPEFAERCWREALGS